jgi:TRAP transporter TAXI family solute receptor
MKGWMAAVAAVVAFALPSSHAQKLQVSIATGNKGGVYYPLGEAIASVIARYVPGVSASVRETGGSLDNVRLLASGRSMLAFTMADAAWDAYQGLDRFHGARVPLRTIAVLYPNRMHVVTLEGRGIERFADLKGRHVSTGAPGSGTELMALRLIEAEGLDPSRDLVREQWPLAQSVAALKRGAIDALFWVGGVPTPSLVELAAASDGRMRLIDHGEAAERMRARYGPIYVRSAILPNAYPGLKVETSNIDVWNLLVVPADADERAVYEITRALFEHKDELAQVHREPAMLELANQTPNASPLPYHPGALRYFREMRRAR